MNNNKSQESDGARAVALIRCYKNNPGIKLQYKSFSEFAARTQNLSLDQIHEMDCNGRHDEGPDENSILDEWKSNPDVQKEFLGDYQAFRAFQKADARGLIKIFVKK